MSTPVICASADFFPHILTCKNTDENAVVKSTCDAGPRFPQWFPQNRVNQRAWPEVRMNQMMLLTPQPRVPHCVS